MPRLSARPGSTALRRPLVADVGFTLAWFVVLAVLGALIWWQLTPLAQYTRTASNAEMGEEQLGRQVSADGWYFVIAAVGGLLSGVALLSLRRRDPLVMVVLVALGALLGGWLMLRVGLWLGPADPKSVLPHVAVGAKVPLRLEPHTHAVLFVWPIAALLGAIGVIWGVDEKTPDVDEGPAHPAEVVPASAHGAAVRQLVTDTRLRPVRIREGYDMAAVDGLLDQVVGAAARGEDVGALIDGTTLPRVRLREAYDATGVDSLLTRIKAVAGSSTIPG